jgi:hypothetical protein
LFTILSDAYSPATSLFENKGHIARELSQKKGCLRVPQEAVSGAPGGYPLGPIYRGLRPPKFLLFRAFPLCDKNQIAKRTACSRWKYPCPLFPTRRYSHRSSSDPVSWGPRAPCHASCAVLNDDGPATKCHRQVYIACGISYFASKSHSRLLRPHDRRRCRP